MNYSTAIFLINKNARAVLCEYEPDGGTTLFKTLDPDVEDGDFVIVETDTRHRMTVVKVTETDVDFDIEQNAPVRWVVPLEALLVWKLPEVRKTKTEKAPLSALRA